MLYSNYEKKVEKVQNILKKIYKFRILIISIIGVLLATTILLMSITGTFSSGLNLSEKEVLYGQEYTYSASAHLSSVDYEFYDKDNGKWSAEKPFKVGEYKIRAVATKVFGVKNYSNEISFEIAPLQTEVGINEETLVYGQQPTCSINLVNGDSVDDVSYNFNSINVGKRTIKVDSIKVVNKAGEDVSFCYDFDFIPEQVDITQKEVKITFLGDSKVYDARPLSNEEFLVDGLVYEDKIETKNFPQITDAGEIENDVEYVIVDKKGFDVYNNYKPIVVKEKLSVLQKTFTIKPKDEKKIYDTKPLTAKEYEIIEGEIVLWHYFSNVSFIGEITDCGTALSEVASLTILDSDRKDVTHNYLYTPMEGSLEITPCEISVSADAKKIYDATSYVDIDTATLNIVRYDQSKGLFPNHEIYYNFVEDASSINAGKYDLQIQEFPTIYFEGNDVTANYDIKLEKGVLEITPCPITINAKAIKTYDATNVVEENESWVDIVRYDYSGGLFYGHEIDYEIIVEENAIDVGSYLLKIKEYPAITFNNEDISFNYEFTLLDGVLEIEKRYVKVLTGTDEKEYDRTALSCADYEILEGDLVDEHKFVIDTKIPTITKVGTIDNYFLLDVVDVYGRSVKYNYDVDQSSFGTLTILKRKMKIELYDVEKVYDGLTATLENRYWWTENKLLAGDSISCIDNYIVKNSNGEQVGIDSIILADKYSVSAECVIDYAYSYTDYYDIEVVGIITVAKAELTVVSNSATKEYDGKPLVDERYRVSFGKVADCDTIDVVVTGVQQTIGDSDNTISEIFINNESVIVNGNGTYEFNNYVITVKQGTLTVMNKSVNNL